MFQQLACDYEVEWEVAHRLGPRLIRDISDDQPVDSNAGECRQGGRVDVETPGLLGYPDDVVMEEPTLGEALRE
jgi:hypothetical protein